MEKYFSTWWDSRNENPFLFFGVILILTAALGLIFWLLKIQKRKTTKLKEPVQEKLEIERKEEIGLKELKVEGPTTHSENVQEIIPKASNHEQSDKFEATKTVNTGTKKNDKLQEPKIKILKTEVTTKPFPKDEIIKAEKEEQSKEKFIGYNPINVFAQTEPLNFPYVIMPKANSIIKFPRKGRVGRKGFKEEGFKVFLDKFFRNEFQVFDDRLVMVKNSNKPYEPDFTLIDEKKGINIFLNIEIDEPYEGLNDIKKRKATHFQYADTNRNNAFASRGWIVIRFAEIQVHQDPHACCNFVADVIKSINREFVIPSALNGSRQLNPVKQWTKEEAEEWSQKKYREQYLEIKYFGVTEENQIIDGLEETELGKKIEEKVIDIPKIKHPQIPKEKPTNFKLDLIKKSVSSNEYLSFTYQGNPTITKPLKATETHLTAFCYVKNLEQTFNIYEISNLLLKSNYNTLRIAGPAIGIDKISSVVNTAINYKRYIRMKYTRASWDNYVLDTASGELILDRIEAEESIRTIMNVHLSINALAEEQIMAYNLNSNYITAYCNKRNEQRTFRFDRIGEIEILDL